ncbi:MAG TPA: MerR family DNA-binding transcriptional regulator [Thermoanaerobaculia bacterium]|nr:MerR family DNA-binding transcriptional regulator [Thermoanaerobaculia bacterium]
MSAEIKPLTPALSNAGTFLSRGDVARLFGVSVSTVTRWARTGLIQAVRTPGGHYRYRADETMRAVSGSRETRIRPD